MSWEVVSKILLNSRKTMSTAPPLYTEPLILSQKSGWSVILLHKSILTHPNYYCVLTMVGNGFQGDLIYHLSREYIKSDWAVVVWFFLLPFLKTAVTFAFLQSYGTSPSCHYGTMFIESGLTMTSSRFLNTHGSIPSGPMDFFLSRLLACSLTWSSSTKDTYSLLQPFPLVSGTWDSWKLVLLTKTHPKKSFSISSFSISSVTRSAIPLSNGSTFSLVFLLSSTYLKKPFFFSLMSLYRFNYIWTLAFQTSPLDVWTLFLYSSQVTCPCFFPWYVSFFMFQYI